MTTGRENIFAPNPQIDAKIPTCLAMLGEEDRRKYTRELAKHRNSPRQKLHAFFELVVGAYLHSEGLRATSCRTLDGKTPDWQILSSDDETEAVLETVAHHADHTTEDLLDEAIKTNQIRAAWVPDGLDRLREGLVDKASKYRSIIEARGLPYIVSICSHFYADIDADDVRSCLKDDGLADRFPHLSGVLFFEENGGMYTFEYCPNAKAAHPYRVPDGSF